MPLVIGIRFNRATKVYYFAPGSEENLSVGEHVVVETARGEEVGRVVIAAHMVKDSAIVGKLKSVVRRASALDLTQMAYYQYRELEALERCREKVQEHSLPMKIIRAEYSYDGKRLVFFFSSEKRVDFRRLVQDLARLFRSRIELRQVGVRDEAKMTGGIGKCGRALCCTTWLTDFTPVSIKMAKLQDLPLSPMEISGICGRLLCCLSYEKEHYTEIRETLPRRGMTIDTPHGRGKVLHVNPITESVHVELESHVTVEVSHEELAGPSQVSSQAPVQAAGEGSRRRRRRRRPKNS